jgi:hypothetical protein
MKKSVSHFRSVVLLTIFFYGISSANSNAQTAKADESSPNTLTQTEKNSGWKLLFDGKTFDGWHGYNLIGIPDCWKVEDGIMKMTTVGGQESQDVITDKTYKRFELKLEFRLTKGANSGIIYHVAEDPKYKFPYETGAEYQVIDQDNWPDKLEDWQICGAAYAMYPPKVRPYKPLGEWNQVQLIVNGNKVTHILNGKVVVEFVKYSDEWKKLRASGKWKDFPDYGKFDEGHISLQNHGTHVDYRSVKIKEL